MASGKQSCPCCGGRHAVNGGHTAIGASEHQAELHKSRRGIPVSKGEYAPPSLYHSQSTHCFYDYYFVCGDFNLCDAIPINGPAAATDFVQELGYEY